MLSQYLTSNTCAHDFSDALKSMERHALKRLGQAAVLLRNTTIFEACALGGEREDHVQGLETEDC